MKTYRILTLLLVTVAISIICVSDSSSETNDVARIGDTHYQDVQSAVSAAIPGDTIVIISDCTVDSDITIREGITLLLPYDNPLNGTDMDGTKDGESKESTTAKIADESHLKIRMTIPADVTVNVEGDVIVGGILSRPFHFDYQGHTSWDYSQIDLDGTMVLNGGSLHCYGFIKGDGCLIATSDSSVYEPLIITDYVGGDNAFNQFYGGQAPFNRYAFTNIQTDFEIDYGSKIHGLMNVYADNKYNKVTVCILGQYGTDEAIILLKEGAVAHLSYDAGRYVMNKHDYEEAWVSNIFKDIGKTTVHLSGNASFGTVRIDIMGYVIDTSKVFFSIPYNIDIILDDGTFSVDYLLRILPGSMVTVGENATFNINGTLIVFDGLEDRTFRDKHYPWTSTLSECKFDICGRLMVNGSLNVCSAATFAGTVETTSNNASISVDDMCESVQNVTVQYGVDIQAPPIAQRTDNITTRTLSAKICNGDSMITLGIGTFFSNGDCTFKETEYTYDIKGTIHTVSVDQDLRGKWKAVNIPTVSVKVKELWSAEKVRSEFESQTEPMNIELVIEAYDLNEGKGLSSSVFQEIPRNLHLSVLVVNGDDRLYKYVFSNDINYVPEKEYIRLQIITGTSDAMSEAISEMKLEKYMTLNMLGACNLPSGTSVTFYLKSVFDAKEHMSIYAFNTDGDLMKFGTGLGVDENTITFHTDRATELMFCIEKEPEYPSIQDINTKMTMAIVIILFVLALVIVLFYLWKKKKACPSVQNRNESETLNERP